MKNSIEELQNACFDGDYLTVKSLLEEGISPNQRDLYGAFPLISASGAGHKQIVELLIEKGADVNVAEFALGKTFTAISQAKALKHPDIVEILIHAGAKE